MLYTKNRITAFRKWCLLVGLICSFYLPEINGQEKDSLTYDLQADTIMITSHFHSPRKALIYSALIPGMGQVYNNKAWKVPFIYGAGGAVLTYYQFNQERYKRFIEHLDNIFQLKQQDPGFNPNNQEYEVYGRIYSSENALENGRDFYRRKRDLSVFYLSMVYFINIIDAMVDAHFYKFDVSDDLSLQVEPTLIPDNILASSTMGFRICVTF